MRAPCVLVLLTAALAAQKMPLPDGDGRIVQVFDIDKVRTWSGGPPADAANPSSVPAEERRADARAIADLLAQFLEPRLGPEDDLQVLGSHHLVLLGTKAQAASADRLLRTAFDHRERLIDVQVQFFGVPDQAFRASLQSKLKAVEREGRESFEGVIADAPSADKLVADVKKASDTQLSAPTLTVFPMQRAHAAVKTTTAYVKDFVVKAADGKFIADPVIDTVWDGNETEVCATYLGNDMLGVTCNVTFQEVEKPIATIECTLPGTSGLKASLQLPRISGTRLQQTAVLPEGGVVVLASSRANGSWLLALIRAQAHAR